MTQLLPVPAGVERIRLAAEHVRLAYDDTVVVRDLDLQLTEGSFTAIVGPNGCGKSTLLRALGRLLRPTSGQVLLDGRAIARTPAREVAKVLGLLPQSPVAPEGLTVGDLVARGRHPHQTWLRQWSADDEAVVAEALAWTDLAGLADRPVDQLSGGQRQRAWISMALAQGTDLLLLDEPTPTSTSPTRSTCWSWSPGCTPNAGARWWWCCTTSTSRRATPSAWWP